MLTSGLTRIASRESEVSSESTAMPSLNSTTPNPKRPRPPASPKWQQLSTIGGTKAATLSGSSPAAAELSMRLSMGKPSRPSTMTASTPTRFPRTLTTSRIVGMGGKLGVPLVEVKPSQWVDPVLDEG